MNAPRVDRLLSRILELPSFMSVELTDLRDSYLLLLGPGASVTKKELSEYLIREMEALMQRALVQQYQHLPEDEVRFYVDEKFEVCEKILFEGPFEKRMRVSFDEEDILNLKSRQEDHKAKLAVTRGEIDECLSLSREFPTLAVTLKERQNELVLQAATLEGRIKLIRRTIHSLSGSYESDS